MLVDTAHLPPPRPLPLPTAKDTYRLAALLVATSATLCVTSAASPDIGAAHAVAVLVAGVVTAAIVGFALRAPLRVMRRCLAVGAIGGAGIGGAVLLVFVVLAAIGPTTEETGLVMMAVTIFFAVATAVGLGSGLVLGAMGATLIGLDRQDARDRADEVLLRASAWVVAAEGPCAWFAATRGATSATVVGLVLVAAGATGAVLVLARDRGRSRWLARVAAGTHPRWVLVKAQPAEPADPPRYVAIDPDACDAAIAHRAADSTPFRANALGAMGARIDTGARRARAIITRRSLLAGATILVAGMCSVAALSVPRQTLPAPPREAPAATARIETHPHRVALGRPAVDIAMYGNAACAVLSNGEADCWGRNHGRFHEAPELITAPVQVQEPPFTRAITLGLEHVCSLGRGGGVTCWGKGDLGQIGNGRGDDHRFPVPVPLVAEARSLALFRHTSCALLKDGTVWCWGQRPGDECGDGDCRYTTTPEQMRGLAAIEEIGAGDANLYARDATGRLVWVGRDPVARSGSALVSDEPVPVALPSAARHFSAGSFGGCVLLAGGDARCWGDNETAGSRPNRDLRDAPLLSGATDVAVGLGFTCKVGAERKVYCWGGNNDGELGDRTTKARDTAAPVLDVDDVDRVVADRHAACALRRDGAVWCWGDLQF